MKDTGIDMNQALEKFKEEIKKQAPEVTVN
jgi:hypothetical protein